MPWAYPSAWERGATPGEARALGASNSLSLHVELSTESELTLSRSKESVQRVVLADTADAPLPIPQPMAIRISLGVFSTEPGQGLRTPSTKL